MDEKRMEEVLQGAIETLLCDEDDYYLQEAGIADIVIDTFEQAGVLTMNKGLVLKIKDEDGERSEFQITIVRSS